MKITIEYDKTNPKSIEAYAQKLIGKTFRQIWDEDESSSEANDYEYGTADVEEKKRRKGNLGQIIEEKFFHYDCNNDARPDFDEAGVELKVTPYKINKNGLYASKQDASISIADVLERAKPQKGKRPLDLLDIDKAPHYYL